LYEVVGSTERFHGAILRVVTDQVRMPDGKVVDRDVVHKFHAVGVVALDDQGRVALVHQYRHAVGAYLWELPAGLVDVDGEDDAQTALRELVEETDCSAGRVEHLLDLHLSPGFTSERIRLFLARDITEVAPEHRHLRVGEEADMQVRWVPLAEAVQMVRNGEITNAASVAGLLAATLKA
jgi:ADP-ribose pyrophosphatase